MSVTRFCRGLYWIGVLFSVSGRTAFAAPPIPLTAGITITRTTSVQPGNYHLPASSEGSVRISGSQFTVDFHGAHLDGGGKGQGIGIRIFNSHHVVIKNADVRGCLWGIVVEQSDDITLQNCVSSFNADLPPGTVIDESGTNPEDDHGGGFLLRDCRNCILTQCRAQHQWDGIDVIRSEANVIQNSDFSYNGNWGLHLWNSSRNIFRKNRAVWCTTGEGTLYQALTGWQTYDSQAVGIDHNSNENLIEGNDLRFGGDGIFIRANEGPLDPDTVVPPRNGSHRNVLRGNDCSFSPNNAIEVDFCDDTVIADNNCSFSHYGMWLGYSRRCIVRRNLCINDAAHAIEIENGQGDHLEENVFGFDTPRPDAALVYLRQNGRDNTPSTGYTLSGNLFYGAHQGVLLRKTDADLRDNILESTGTASTLVATVGACQVSQVNTRLQASGEGSADLASANATAIRPGKEFRLQGIRLSSGGPPPVVELEGIPVWVQKASDQEIVCRMPEDFWDRPAKTRVSLRVHNGNGWSAALSLALKWPPQSIRVDTVRLEKQDQELTLILTGANLTGNVRLNNRPAQCTNISATHLVVHLPDGVTPTTPANLIVVRSPELQTDLSWPITITAARLASGR